MFSSLDLDDGPLTVHDLERLDRAPHRIVLSACESGVVAPIGAGEMLGLVSAMLVDGLGRHRVERGEGQRPGHR